MRQLRAPNIAIEELHRRQRPSKGVGHLDSIGDAIMEQVSMALCREYRATFGRILHHVDPT